MTFVILTGGIDLSAGSILAASAVAAMLCSTIGGWGWLGIPAALGVGLGFGVINGSLISLLRLPPFIVTLGSLTAVRGIARLMGHDTTIFNPQLSFAFIGNGTVFGVPWLVIIALAVVGISWFVLRRTVLGFALQGVHAADKQLKSIGITVGSLGNPYFVTIVKGAEAKARQINPNAKITAVSADYDLNRQFTQIDNFISAHVDMILLNASDPKAIEPAVR